MSGSLVGPRPGSWPVGRVVGDYFGGWKHSPGGGSYLDGTPLIQATLSNLCFLRFLSEAGPKIERRPGRPGALKAPIRNVFVLEIT